MIGSPANGTAAYGGDSKRSGRVDFADALRALATASIVFLHVSSPIAQNPGMYPSARWWIANVVYSLTRPSIAIFVMVSGFLLLSPIKEESIALFFRKRFARIVVPFVVWGAVYFFWKTHGEISATACARLGKEFIEGPVYYHLWFIYTIVGIYLATPVFRVYVRHASRSNYLYLVSTWFIGTCLYPLVSRFCGIAVGIPIMTAGGFLGTFLLGDFVRTLETTKRVRRWLVPVLTVCLAATALSGYALSGGKGAKYDSTFQEFLSVNVVIAAVSIFVLFKEIRFDMFKMKFPRAFSLITAVSSASFSVYLMHILVLEILKGHIPVFSLDATCGNPILGIPLTAVVTLAFCVTITLLLRKIPFMKFVLP